MARRTQLGITPTSEELELAYAMARDVEGVLYEAARSPDQYQPTRAQFAERLTTTRLERTRPGLIEEPTRLRTKPLPAIDERADAAARELEQSRLRQYGSKLADQGERQIGAVRRSLKEASAADGVKACGKARTALFALGMTLGRVRAVLEVSRSPAQYHELLYTPLQRDADAFATEYEASCLVPEFMRETPEDELAETALRANLFKGPEGPRMRADRKSTNTREREALSKYGIGPVTQGPTITETEVRRRTRAVRDQIEADFERATRETFAKFAEANLGKFVEIGGKRYGPLTPDGEIPPPIRRQIETRHVKEREKLDRSAQRQKLEERQVKLEIAAQKAREAGPDKVAILTKDGSIKIIDRALAEEAKRVRGVKILKRQAKNERLLATEAEERGVREDTRKANQVMFTQPRLFVPGKG